jgi:hypothetical protein
MELWELYDRARSMTTTIPQFFLRMTGIKDLLRLEKRLANGPLSVHVLRTLFLGFWEQLETATWRRGYAADCKSVYSGSNPDVASNPLQKNACQNLRCRQILCVETTLGVTC